MRIATPAELLGYWDAPEAEIIGLRPCQPYEADQPLGDELLWATVPRSPSAYARAVADQRSQLPKTAESSGDMTMTQFLARREQQTETVHRNLFLNTLEIERDFQQAMLCRDKAARKS